MIFGSAVDETLAGRIRVSVVATGIDSQKNVEQQPRPKLVAVGGGAAPVPQPILVRGVAKEPILTTAAVHAVSASPLRQPSHDMESIGNTAIAMEAPVQQPALVQRPLQARPPQFQPQPVAQPASRATLFADAQRPASMPPVNGQIYGAPDSGRPSLFNTVTGAFRRRAAAPAVGAAMQQPQPMRRDLPTDDYHPEAPRVSVQQTSAAEETGIEIPAFLRRQSS